MKVYDEINIFDSRTGKPKGKRMEQSAIVCDYCGKQILDDGTQQVTFTVNQIGGAEETWYYEGFSDLKEGVKINNYALFANNETYHYCQDEEGASCSHPMVTDGLKLSGVFNLEAMMEDARRKVVVRLLNEDKITTKQLQAEV